MFKLKKKKDVTSVEVPEGAPATAMSPRVVFRRYVDEGGVQVERNRYFLVILILSAVMSVMALAMILFFPLKTVVPYVIKVDSIGRAQPIQVAPEKFVASDAEIKYHTAQWINDVMTIRPGITRLNAKNAFNIVDGDAVGQFGRWMTEYRPIEKAVEHPEITTDTYVTSINKLSDHNLLVQFYTVTTTAGSAEKQYWTATLNYSTFVPKTEEEILVNPIGMRIESFSISKVIGGNPK